MDDMLRNDKYTQMSRPVWGAWIEIEILSYLDQIIERRAPYGARGLKSNGAIFCMIGTLVAPRMGRVD